MAHPHDSARDAFCALPLEVRHVAILAGGAARSFIDGTSPKDYDLFFRCEADYQRAVDLMRAGVFYEELEDAGRTKVFRDRVTGRVFNLIGFAYGTPQETIDRFDFRCCRMAFWLLDGRDPSSLAYLGHPDAVSDCLEKRLVVLLCNGEERTLRRIEHYIDDYGYALPELPAPEEVFAPDDEDAMFEPDPPVVRARRHYVRSLPRGGGGYN